VTTARTRGFDGDHLTHDHLNGKGQVFSLGVPVQA
jgi:hypothetical protein